MDKLTHLQCFDCLEKALVYVDAGLSESTATFLAGSEHVCGEKFTFHIHAWEHLLTRWQLTQPPLREDRIGRTYHWEW